MKPRSGLVKGMRLFSLSNPKMSSMTGTTILGCTSHGACFVTEVLIHSTERKQIKI